MLISTSLQPSMVPGTHAGTLTCFLKNTTEPKPKGCREQGPGMSPAAAGFPLAPLAISKAQAPQAESRVQYHVHFGVGPFFSFLPAGGFLEPVEGGENPHAHGHRHPSAPTGVQTGLRVPVHQTPQKMDKQPGQSD